MKKFSSVLIWFLTFVLGIGFAVGQNSIKVGHTNTGYILSQLPEIKGVQTELETVRTQLEKVIQDKSKEFQEKLERYQNTGASMSQAQQETAENELRQLNSELEELQAKSQQTFAEKQESLIRPLVEKVNKAVDEVAKENGYTYILNGDTGNVGNPVILYSGSKETDITDLVLKKLGVTVTNN